MEPSQNSRGGGKGGKRGGPTRSLQLVSDEKKGVGDCSWRKKFRGTNFQERHGGPRRMLESQEDYFRFDHWNRVGSIASKRIKRERGNCGNRTKRLSKLAATSSGEQDKAKRPWVAVRLLPLAGGNIVGGGTKKG